MTIETNITNRRELASALAQYMNTRAIYLGPPTFAYQIGDIHLSREGILSGNDLDGIFPFLEMQGIVVAQPKMIQEPAENTAPGIRIPLEGYTLVNLRNFMKYGTPCNTLREGADGEGGFLVPDEFEKKIISALTEKNVIRSLARVITTERTMKLAKAVGGGHAYWVPEEGPYPETSTVFDQIVLGAYKLGDMIRVSDELLEDSAFDIEDFIAKEFVRRFAQAEEDAFLLGDGKGKPLGIVHQIEKTITTQNAGKITADDLVDLQHSIPQKYRKNAVYVMSDATLRELYKIKSAYGRNIWAGDLTTGLPLRLFGYPVIILVKSISRFARNTVTLLETVRELKALGIDVHFEEQSIHTMSGDGELMLTSLASFAQEESRSVSDNCKWRIRNQFANGQPTGQTIYGFDVKNGMYTIREQEAEVVRSIYDMYLSGMGRLKIVRALNEKGILSPDGGEWVPSVVSDILRNEKYVGDLMLQKYYVNNHIEKKTVPNRGELPQYFVQDDHEGIVDRDTFLMVQVEMERRKKKYGRKREKKIVTTEGLTGRIFCGQCGKGYNRKITRAGTSYAKPVWICRTFNLKGKALCASKQIPEDILLPIVQEVYESGANVERILVQSGNVLEFILTDGKVISRTWKDHSRRESWTPEKREQARQKMMHYHSERRACANE